MPYPDNIIARLTDQYNLQAVQQQALRESLTVDGLQPIVESGLLNPENILIQGQAAAAEAIILPPSITKLLAIDPTQLDALRTLVRKFPTEIILWDNITKQIEELNRLPLSQLRQRKVLASQISLALLPLARFVTSHELILTAYDTISITLPQHMNALEEAIDSMATTYFARVFNEGKKNISNITFFQKLSGVQLGRRMVIEYTHVGESEKHTITYYIKSHQHGSTSQVSSVKPVDPKELFMYKVLEYTGFGPKMHFFFNPLSKGGFFIATQDVAFTKVPGRDKFFTKYAVLKPDYDKGDVEPHHELAKEISRTDILSRIFCLYDVTTNPDNFGRVTIDKQRSKWKIVDFRLEDRPYYIVRDIFEGFREGNGMYNYTGFLGRLLRDRPEPERIDTATQVMTEFEVGKRCYNRTENKMPLRDAVHRSFCEIARYIQKHAEPLGIDLIGTLGTLATLDLNAVSDETILSQLDSLPRANAGDFGRYVKDSKENLNAMATGIRAWHTELSSQEGPTRHPGAG